MVGDTQLAQDLVQEALTRTYVAWPRLRDPCNAEASSRKGDHDDCDQIAVFDSATGERQDPSYRSLGFVFATPYQWLGDDDIAVLAFAGHPRGAPTYLAADLSRVEQRLCGHRRRQR